MFEMTHDTRVFPPLLLAIVMSTLVTRSFQLHSLYTLNLDLGKFGRLDRSKTTPRNGPESRELPDSEDNGAPPNVAE